MRSLVSLVGMALLLILPKQVHAGPSIWTQFCSAAVVGFALCISGGCDRQRAGQPRPGPVGLPAAIAPERPGFFSFSANSATVNGVFQGTITIERDGKAETIKYTDRNAYERDFQKLSR